MLLAKEQIKLIYNEKDCVELKELKYHSFECNYYEKSGRTVKMIHEHKILFAFKKDGKVYLKYETWEGEFWVIGNDKMLIRDTYYIFENALNDIKRKEKIWIVCNVEQNV